MNAQKTQRITRAKQKIAAGILLQARRDLRRFCGSTRARERELYLDAYTWVTSNNYSWRYSFCNVCKILNLVPEVVREELIRDLSLGAFRYCSRRAVCALRRFHLSLRKALATAPDHAFATS